jgi:hypothetical protein
MCFRFLIYQLVQTKMELVKRRVPLVEEELVKRRVPLVEEELVKRRVPLVEEELVKRRVPPMEEELLTLTEHLSSCYSIFSFMCNVL